MLPTSPKKPSHSTTSLPPVLRGWVADKYLQSFDPQQSRIVKAVSLTSVVDYARQQKFVRNRHKHMYEIIRYRVCIPFSCASLCTRSTDMYRFCDWDAFWVEAEAEAPQ